MINRINQLPATGQFSYYDRIQILRERKIEDTLAKRDNRRYQDGDDYGSVQAPEEFVFKPHVTHANGGWYGYEGWSETFYNLMAVHPIHIDPCDAFCNRWMFALIWMRQPGTEWNPDHPFDHLVEDQQRYGLVHGIGSDAHFGGDYQIGL
ncbi:MAG: formate acetyltransferase, partial [Bacillota bacterium]|nr:formate acetyltransferase [Bacillota bacterium]